MFISKINIFLEEADESVYWLEIINIKKYGNPENSKVLLKESNELTAIFVTILKKMQNKLSIAKN